MSPAPAVLVANPGADLYGSDRMVLETVSALVADGWRVVVTVPETGKLVAELKARGAEVALLAAPIIRKSALRPAGLAGLLRDTVRAVGPALRLMRDLDPAVVVVNTITSPLWLLLGKLRGRPTLCHLHEAEGSASRAVRAALYSPLWLADRILVNSDFTRRVMTESLPGVAARAAVVHNTVRGRVAPTPTRADYTEPVRLLYVGRLAQRKGPQVLIDAAATLRERGIAAAVDLVGAAFRENRAFEVVLRQQVADVGLDDLVTFRGWHDDVGPFIRDADILVVPSVVDESFGNTAVEAVLAGRPVVVSDCGGLAEAVDGFDCAVLVTPGDPDRLADAVQEIAKDWSRYGEAATRDAVAAGEQFSPTVYARAVCDAVAAVAAKR